MPIYTQDPGKGINQPISNVDSGLGESLLSSLKQGFDEGPIMSGYRFSQADSLANDPNSITVSKPDADARLAEYGVKSINVPDGGVTKSFLDHVIGERKQSLEKQQIMRSAPTGWVATPLNFAAGLAGAMADPGNVALGFIPFAGEAKAASLAGRFGERLLSGARMGAAQAVATVPLTAMAAAAEGDDFTYGNALESTFFNTIAGGLMHASGGLIADMVKPRAKPETAKSPLDQTGAETQAAESQPTPIDSPDTIPAGIDIPKTGTNADMATMVSSDVDNYAYSRAYNDVIPDYMARQQELSQAVMADPQSILTEINANNARLSETESSVKSRAQSKGANQEGTPEIPQASMESEAAQIRARNNELSAILERNNSIEKARADVEQISKGGIPDGVRGDILQRAEQIRDGLGLSPVSGAVKNAAGAIRDANWSVNQQAYRASLAHIMDGRAPDVDAFYDLHKPELRDRAVQRIQNPVSQIDESAGVISNNAEKLWKETQKTDSEITSSIADLENEFNISNALLDDIAIDNPELANSMRDNINAIRQEANDNSMVNAFKAFASCMINRGL